MPTRFLRVSLKGTIGSSEVWSVNPVFALPVQAPSDMSYEQALERAEAVAALTVPAGVRAIWGTAVALTAVSIEARDNAGDLTMAAEHQLVAPVTGTGTPTKVPQTSWVSSLRTNAPGGRARGRLYWPALGVVLTYPSCRIPSGTVTTQVAAVNSYLAAIQDAVNIGEIFPVEIFSLAVWSRVGGLFTPVTRIMGGDVLDTQRRRRDALPETYQSVDYVP